jgi:predicted ABC-type ATPase
LPTDARVLNFVNADLIAAGLSPLRPKLAAVAAARLVLEEIARLIELRADFAWESTLSGLTYVKRIRAMKQLGYHVEIIYKQLASPRLALRRIAGRVRQGGHNVQKVPIQGSRTVIVEQVHRAIKRRCASMAGFKSFHNAAITIAGAEIPIVLHDRTCTRTRFRKSCGCPLNWRDELVLVHLGNLDPKRALAHTEDRPATNHKCLISSHFSSLTRATRSDSEVELRLLSADAPEPEPSTEAEPEARRYGAGHGREWRRSGATAAAWRAAR